jgi:poly(A) polymerase
MQRAVSFAARLGFTIDPPILDAIASERQRIALAAPARLAEEYYKILRSGAAERTFSRPAPHGPLEPLSDVLDAHAGDALWASLARLDAYRLRFEAPPAALSNGVLLGSLIAPLGFSQAGWPAWMQDESRPGLNLGVLPLARRDVERIHQVLMLQRRLCEPSRSSHARRLLMQRSAFADALTWLEIHGDAPDKVAFWREHGAAASPEPGEPPPAPPPPTTAAPRRLPSRKAPSRIWVRRGHLAPSSSRLARPRRRSRDETACARHAWTCSATSRKP